MYAGGTERKAAREPEGTRQELKGTEATSDRMETARA